MWSLVVPYIKCLLGVQYVCVSAYCISLGELSLKYLLRWYADGCSFEYLLLGWGRGGCFLHAQLWDSQRNLAEQSIQEWFPDSYSGVGNHLSVSGGRE